MMRCAERILCDIFHKGVICLKQNLYDKRFKEQLFEAYSLTMQMRGCVVNNVKTSGCMASAV